MHVDPKTLAVALIIALAFTVPTFLWLLYRILNTRLSCEGFQILKIRTKNDVRLQAAVEIAAPMGWTLFNQRSRYVLRNLEESLRIICESSTADEIFAGISVLEDYLDCEARRRSFQSGIKVCILKLEPEESGLRMMWNYYHKQKK